MATERGKSASVAGTTVRGMMGEMGRGRETNGTEMRGYKTTSRTYGWFIVFIYKSWAC